MESKRDSLLTTGVRASNRRSRFLLVSFAHGGEKMTRCHRLFARPLKTFFPKITSFIVRLQESFHSLLINNSRARVQSFRPSPLAPSSGLKTSRHSLLLSTPPRCVLPLSALNIPPGSPSFEDGMSSARWRSYILVSHPDTLCIESIITTFAGRH